MMLSQRRALSRARDISRFPFLSSSHFRIYFLSTLLAAFLLICLPFYFKASAADGGLDPTFGIGGKVVTSFAGGLDTANAVAVQTDGKLVVAGYSGSDFALARYNSNGTLDATFGTGGMVHTDFPVGLGGLAFDMVIQSDGKIVLAGSATDSTSGFDSVFALARYNTDGSLDTSFDGDGRVVTPFPGGSANAEAIALQPDGKLVVAGSSTNSTTFASVFALARYNTNGSLDTSFDTDGKVTIDIPGLTFEQAHAVAIQANGRIVIAGQGSSAFALARVNADGSLDTGAAGDTTAGDSFGTGGIVTTAFGGTFEEARDLAIQADGRIIAAGLTARSIAAEDNFALARYNTDGSLDTNFDTDGKVTTDFGLVDAANGVVIQTDGRIIAAGSAGTIAGGSFFALARYNTNGSLDTSFDTDGKATTDLSGGRFGLGALDVALQTDGRIVAAGDSNISGQRDFGVARYNTDGSLDAANFGAGGKVITDFPLNEDTITGLVIQPDGKIVASGRFNGRVRIKDAQDPNFQLARYNTDGSLDTTFGTGGIVTTDFLIHGDDFANAIALQTDGKLVVAGQAGANFSQIPSADTTFALARYNSNGTLDTTFGTGGLVTTDFGTTTHDSANAVAIQPDGKIVLAGTNGTDFALARYNTNGSLDTGAAGDTTPGDSFGTGGKQTTDFAGGFDAAAGVVIQTDGKIVAAGAAGADFGLARYNPDGSLDTANFGTSGKVTTDFFGNSDAIARIVIQPNGKLVVAGQAALSVNNTDFALARYNTDGSLDTSFDGDGKVTTDFGGFDAALGLALQADGKIVAAGFYFPSTVATAPNGTVIPNATGPASFFAVARYNTDGSLDSSFGTGGKVTTDFFGVDNQATSVAIQTNGGIVVGGFTDTGSSTDFALARYTSAIAPAATNVQFNASNFNTPEGTHDVQITLTRTGDTSGATSVDYLTSDGTAQQRTDYTIQAGTITFAAGETTKTFALLVNDDNYVEGNEQFNVTLSNPTGGAVLGSTNAATVTITDNDTANPPTANVIDDSQNFVQQHYHDFLSREPDTPGRDYWTSQITACGTNQQCLRAKRIDVANAFFFEMEYQDTAAYVYRIYKASFGTRPTYAQFAPDRSRVVGSPTLDAMKTAFAAQFVQRTGFNLPLDPAAYVDALNTNTGNSLTQAQRDALVTGLTNSTETRASVLRKVAENQTFVDKEYNNSFVLALYFGYLRRDPEAGGFDFWLAKINAFPLRNIAGQHALVCSFITSTEYQQRFSSVVTHSNSECSQ